MTEFRIPQKALDEIAALAAKETARPSNVIPFPTKEPDPFEGMDSVAVSSALGASLSGETVEETEEPQEPLAPPEGAADPRAEDRYAKIVKGLTRSEDGSYSGFVCAECHRPVDSYVRGAHDQGCSLAVNNESLMVDADLYQRFAREHADG